MTRVGYRVSQFMHAAFARPEPGEGALVDRHLPAPLRFLFARLEHSERAHALAILRTLLQQGHTDPDLLAAALLHDIGKSRAPLRLTDRALVVMARALAPKWAERWSRGEPSGWRRPFVVAAHHASWGEALVRQAGGSSTLAELVRRHHDQLPVAATPGGQLLKALQAADGNH